MNDLFGLSGASKEIVNAISAGIGTLYRPRQIRSEAEAQAYATLVQADAAVQSDLIARSGAGDEAARRAVERLRSTLLSQQRNLDAIFERAIIIANSVHSPTLDSVKIDPDWMTQFINFAQDVSQEELRAIWAKVLSKQASDEGAVSIRTLDVLRTLTRTDALAFQSFLKIKMAFGGEFHPIESDCMARNGLHSEEIHKLAEIGLIQSPKIEWNNVNYIQQCYPKLSCTLMSLSPYTTKVADHFISIYGDDDVSMYAYRLTTIGREIEHSLGRLEIDNVNKEDLFESFKEVLTIRLRYKFECDSEVDEERRLCADNEPQLISGDIPYSEWKKQYR
jgi:hypothetical protein